MISSFRSIVITGATGGIGSALAHRLAGPGCAFLLFGRDAERMAALVREVEAKGSTAVCVLRELGDATQLDKDIADFDANHPIDIVFTCAACKFGNVDGMEEADELRRVIEANVIGSMMTAQACLSRMQLRGKGRIVLFSSLAAASPQPDLISYSASKAAISAYATALRRSQRKNGVGVSLVLPGFVDTEMTRRHNGPTPFLLTAGQAAGIIADGVRRGKRTIAFPKRLAALSWLERLAPPFIADFVHDRLRAEIISEKASAPVKKAK